MWFVPLTVYISSLATNPCSNSHPPKNYLLSMTNSPPPPFFLLYIFCNAILFLHNPNNRNSRTYQTKRNFYPLKPFIPNLTLLFRLHLKLRPQLERNNLCSNNCMFNVYLMQAHTRKNWCEVTVNSLKTLLTIDTITNGSQLAGWGVFNKELAKERIRIASASAKQADKDITDCENTLKTGCQWCIPRKWKNETKNWSYFCIIHKYTKNAILKHLFPSLQIPSPLLNE